VIGTAGDRRDEDIRALGELVTRRGAGVVVKRTERYLRGRTQGELIALYLAGIAAGGGDPTTTPVVDSEVEGLRLALARSAPGDVVCVMCQEQREELWALLGNGS
jgi:cyanophycin synthetase